MSSERRQQERTSCSIPCTVSGSGKAVDGVVRDVSAGGLSVQVDMPAEQGDSLCVALQRGPTAIEVRGIVWHVRRGRTKGSGQVVQRLGLVLSEAPDEFHALLPAKKAASKQASGPRTAGASIATSKAAKTKTPKQPEAKPLRYRIRVKQDSGPRTRSILVFAPDEGRARACARSETGDGWHILEVERG